MEHQHVRSFSDFLASKHLKKLTIQILLSVSLFFFIFSWRSSLMYDFKSHSSSFPFDLLGRALSKNCIFLICNGLLVAVAKTSILARSPSGYDVNDIFHKKIDDGLEMVIETKEGSSQMEAVVKNAIKEEEEEEEQEVEQQEEEEEEEKSIDEETTNEQEHHEEPKETLKFIIGDEEEDEENEPENVVGEESGGAGGDGGGDSEEGNEGDGAYDRMEEAESEDKFDQGLLFIGGEEEEEYGFGDEEYRPGEEGKNQIELLSTEELNQKFEDFIRKMKEELRIDAKQQQQLVVVK